MAKKCVIYTGRKGDLFVADGMVSCDNCGRLMSALHFVHGQIDIEFRDLPPSDEELFRGPMVKTIVAVG